MTSNIGSENNIHANHLNIFIFLSSLLLSSINSKLINIKTLNFNGASGAVYINIMLPTIVLFASCTNSGYYTQLFLNIYGMWHVYLYKVDGSLATEPVDVTIVVGSI